MIDSHMRMLCFTPHIKQGWGESSSFLLMHMCMHIKTFHQSHIMMSDVFTFISALRAYDYSWS